MGTDGFNKGQDIEISVAVLKVEFQSMKGELATIQKALETHTVKEEQSIKEIRDSLAVITAQTAHYKTLISTVTLAVSVLWGIGTWLYEHFAGGK